MSGGSFIAPLLREILVNGMVAKTAVQTARHGTVGAGYALLAGSIGFLGLVFFSIAGYGLLLESFPMPVAAGITGGVIMVLSAIVGGIGYYNFKKIRLIPKAKPKVFNSGSPLAGMEDIVKEFVDGLEDPVRENPKTAMLLAALAGFAAGDRLN